MKISYLSTMILAMTVCFVGCAGLGDAKLRGPNAFKKMLSDEEPTFITPSSMVAIWKPSTFEKPGSKSIRGFGGRFYFHNAKNEPVKVDGLLTIYGYDDADGDASGKADRKFIFESSTFQQHYSASGLGDSYSFWVPWDEVGGFEKTITLIPVFKSANGQIPESKPATLRLPGKKPEVIASAQNSLYGPGTQVISASGVVSEKPMVKHAVALTDVSELSDAGNGDMIGQAGRRKTTTFRLPRNLADRMARTTPTADRITNPSNQSIDPTSDPMQSLAKGNSNLNQANLNQANPIGSTMETSSIDNGQSKPINRASRPVFGQPGSF